MSKPLKEIIAILSQNEIGNDYTYVGKNYTKTELIEDLYALRGNYSHSGAYSPMSNDVFAGKEPEKKTGKGKKKRESKIKKIVKRDGEGCFYCGEDLKKEDITIEHLKAKANGGGGSLRNLKIACVTCNVKAGHKTVEEKLKMRVTK